MKKYKCYCKLKECDWFDYGYCTDKYIDMILNSKNCKNAYSYYRGSFMIIKYLYVCSQSGEQERVMLKLKEI